MGGGIGGSFGNTRGSKTKIKIHEGRQNKHIFGTRNYKQELANGRTPSILTDNPERLLKEGSGYGRSVTSKKEAVEYGYVIGKYYDLKTKQYYDTTRAIIHYDDNGNAHIVPARPKGFIGGN